MTYVSVFPELRPEEAETPLLTLGWALHLALSGAPTLLQNHLMGIFCQVAAFPTWGEKPGNEGEGRGFTNTPGESPRTKPKHGKNRKASTTQEVKV